MNILSRIIKPRPKRKKKNKNEHRNGKAKIAPRQSNSPSVIDRCTLLAAKGKFAESENEVLEALLQNVNAAIVPALLQQYCRLAVQTKQWITAVRRWHLVEAMCPDIDPALQIAVAEAYIVAGDLEKARSLVSVFRNDSKWGGRVTRIDALLAEAEENWAIAAQIWLDRAKKTNKARKPYNYVRAIKAFIQADDFHSAELACQSLIGLDPHNTTTLRLSAEIAIRQDAWEVALDRWQKVDSSDGVSTSLMPAQWLYRIGLDAARKRTEAIEIAHLRASGMMSLAAAMEEIDEPGALLLARRARELQKERVLAMLARVLHANARHSAATWWLKRLIEMSPSPRLHYPLLVESLLESSRLDECESVAAAYRAEFGEDALWLRAMMEIHYRRNDFASMRKVMDIGISALLKKPSKSLRVTQWIYQMIRLHPDPPSFLPEEVGEQVIQIAQRYDTRFLANSLQMLLKPQQGNAAAEAFSKLIVQAENSEAELDTAQREEMLQFFLRRREWDHVHRLLEMPLPEQVVERDARKVWNIVRNKIDVLLGEARVTDAEAVAEQYLEQLFRHDLHGTAVASASGLLFRLPRSERLVKRLLTSADHVGFSQMVQRLDDWKERYANFPYETTVSIAKRERCFVVGNAPSIADMPLHLLDGEDIICVNRGMRALDMGLPQPKYLVVGDPLVYKNHAREIDADAATVEKFFVMANCLWRTTPRVPAVPVGSSGLKLSLAPFQHAPLQLHRGDTVVVLAVQLAHLMGYREIYVIGVDLDYSGPVTHFYGGGRKESERLSNFRPGGSGTEMTNLAFANLREVIGADGCRLYNAAPAGRLETLERVSFEAVLSGHTSHEVRKRLMA